METLISITLWNVVLFGALLAFQPMVRVIKSGPAYALSNFDLRNEEGAFARRLAMVRTNQGEALALLVPVIVIASVIVPDLTHPHLSLIAATFMIARLSYTVVSLMGIPVLRSSTWIFGFAAWGYLSWIVFSAVADQQTTASLSLTDQIASATYESSMQSVVIGREPPRKL